MLPNLNYAYGTPRLAGQRSMLPMSGIGAATMAKAHATAEELGLAEMAHLFLQQARRELPERKPAAEAVRVKVQKKADRR
jgi:hypothetical protein